MDFIETLFRFLGRKPPPGHRVYPDEAGPGPAEAFINELAECENLREQARCVRRSIGHLKPKTPRP
ncbi:MAG: hypothetical protein R2860_13075 [Desulfobacterales bacterium]